jgi:hypothetical protein
MVLAYRDKKVVGVFVRFFVRRFNVDVVNDDEDDDDFLEL